MVWLARRSTFKWGKSMTDGRVGEELQEVVAASVGEVVMGEEPHIVFKGGSRWVYQGGMTLLGERQECHTKML